MVKPFDRYILKEIASPFSIGLLVYTSTLAIDQILRLSGMLITKNVSLATFFLIIIYMLPDLLSFTIPMASLMGILAGMSRMSSDSEILALRTMGINNWRILKPLMLFSSLAFLTSFLFVSYLAPEANYRLSRMLVQVQISYNITNIKPGIFCREIPYYTIYFKEYAQNGNWKNVILHSQKDPEEDILIMSKEGKYLHDPISREGQIFLFDGVIHSFKKNKPDELLVAFFQQNKETISTMGPIVTTRRSTQLTLPQLYKRIQQEPHDLLAQMEFHNKFALPFASIALGFLGLSLGISTKKGGKASGLIISLGIIFIYYVMITAARNLILKSIISPFLGMWMPNIFLLTVGFAFFLLLKKEREINWEKFFSLFFPSKQSSAAPFSPRPSKTKSLFRILDTYILRRSVSLFVLVLISLLLVFYIINIIDLMDEIIENRIPFIYNLKYIFYMTPNILTLILPIAILTSILLTFSFMSKNNEVIAVQVSGISLYRLTIPVFILGLVASSFIFGVQEAILPKANEKAIATLEFIHKRKSAAEMELNRNWVLGKQNQVYFYSYLEKEQDRFTTFNILSFDDNFILTKRINARYAKWLNKNNLRLSDVMVRKFENQIPVALQKTQSLNLHIQEERSAFFEYVKFSTQMSISELKRYIQYLKKNQTDTRRYEAQLFYNYSFPLTSLVMAFIAIPFAFLMGNRGALFGIGMAVGISLTYWGALGIFSALGKTALLGPFISAFAPLILFITFSAFLLFRVKT